MALADDPRPATVSASGAVPAASPETPLVHGTRAWWRLFARDRAAVAGLGIVALFVVAALMTPILPLDDPLEINPARSFEGPSADHLFGTDNVGRDVFSRILHGSRLSLGTAALAAAVVMILGVMIGIVSGLRGGWVDGLLMRLVDGLLVFPPLILALAIAGTIGEGLLPVVLALTAVSWATYARLVRGLVLQIRERPFVEAGRASGSSPSTIAVRHVLPNVIPPVIVLLTIEMGSLILSVSGLSFLGIGAQPPAPEWGAMLNDGRRFLYSAPELMLYPGLAIFLVVLGFNLLGDGLRDILDPKGRGRRA